jgi:hypothetical protein
VQLPTKYSSVVNLNAAQGARFAIPPAVLAPVDQGDPLFAAKNTSWQPGKQCQLVFAWGF